MASSYERSNITIEDFIDKLMSGEYYVNPEAHNNPRQSDILEDLEKVEAIIMQKKELLKNSKDIKEMDRLLAEL
ncbi:MAG: hypothetical protein M3239_02075, partial [Thermoproteota archaeon]|nr:hypothetical protein [Thermoproteota archaeon]